MLKRIDRRNPAHHADDAFKVLASRPRVLGRRVENVQMLGAEQLHRHAGDFAEFHRRRAEEHERLGRRGRQVVERVAALVEQRLDVALDADRVHEDERLARLLERHLVAAGLLALAAGQIEVVARPQRLKLVRELRREAGEDRAGLVDELLGRRLLERPQRRAVLRVDRQVPRPQGAQPQVLTASAVQFGSVRRTRSAGGREALGETASSSS